MEEREEVIIHSLGERSKENVILKKKKTNIGGQALLEGILMKGPEKTAIAIRNKEEIVLKVEPTDSLAAKHKLFSLPFIRGVGILFDSMTKGMKALEYSASFDEAYKSEKEEKKKNPILDKLESLLFIIFGLGLALLIFFILPGLLVDLVRKGINNRFLENLLEGLLRIGFFLVYVLLISKQKDIKRVFMYHGAEHKTINCYEAGEDLTLENVKKHSRLHPRCGTSFMINLVIIAAIIFSFFNFPNRIVRLIVRLLAIPLLVGITYELNRWMGRSDSGLSKVLSKAGLWIQRVATVREPDEGMIECAILAMNEVIPEDPEADIWK